MTPRPLAIACVLLGAVTLLAADPAPSPIWPGKAPGETKSYGPEADLSKPTDGPIAGRQVLRLGNVVDPTVTVYRPPADKDTGAAVVVFPGGGYYILALDLEGTEVCQWLNSIGVTGVLLKYRVPRREGLPPYFAPLQDAQRAVGIVRAHARDWGIDPNRIGVLGFSAGGNLAAALSAHPQRVYPRVDASDDVSCTPDFQILIYPGGLVPEGSSTTLAPEVAVSKATPPTFLTMAEDDPVRAENALGYAVALNALKVPMELHIYPTGGHGYGLRPTKDYVTSWPSRAADWMRSRGLLASK